MTGSVSEPSTPRGKVRTACGAPFDDLADTVPAGRHGPLRPRVLCLWLMGLNLSDRQIARELDLFSIR